MRWVLGLPIFLLISACGDDDSDEIEAACQSLEKTWRIEDIPEFPSCPAPPTPRDLSTHDKLAIAVFHFNLQYVAGGTRGFPDGTVTRDNDYDEKATEDLIIRVSFEPFLDGLLTHPTYVVDLEMQSYMLEVMAIRHPDVLDKLRTLAQRGQVDVDSFHYSDQLYIAYPREDQEISLEMTRQIFERVCVPRGRSVFTQEGQFGIGQLSLAKAAGFGTSLLPKNLYSYQFGPLSNRDPGLFEHPSAPDHYVLLGGRSFTSTASGQNVELNFTFMDDGEIAFTKAKLNPYFGKQFEWDPARLEEYFAQLADLEARGYVLATVHEATQAIISRGIQPQPLPNVLDGTWQPSDTLNAFRWMGGSGLFRAAEKDSEVLAANWRARTKAHLLGALEFDDARAKRGALAAWREALLAEVSDSTGWNPFANEIRYSLDRAALSESTADAAMSCSSADLPKRAEPTCEGPAALDELGVEIVAPARQIVSSAKSCTYSSGKLFRIDLDIKATAETDEFLDPTEMAAKERELEISFPLRHEHLALVPAMTQTFTSVILDDYVFEDIGVPLTGGVARVDARTFVVQDLHSGRVAARIARSGPNSERLRFVDLTVSRIEDSRRTYYVLQEVDEVAAFEFAHELNLSGI